MNDKPIPSHLTSDLDKQRYLSFFENYERQEIYVGDSRIILGDNSHQQCRFCLKKPPEIKIRNNAHVLTQALGFRWLYSSFECDTCNQGVFADYDNSLAKYFGPMRSFTGIRGKDGYPKHKYQDSPLFIQRLDNDIEVKELMDGGLELDADNNIITMKAVKEPYTEIKVFKALVKAGFCFLNNEELQNFDLTRQWLISPTRDSQFGNYDFKMHIRAYELNLKRKLTPSIQLYRRRIVGKNEKAPEKCLIVIFGNYELQFFIPFSIQDAYIAKSKGSNWVMPIRPILDFQDEVPKYVETIKSFNSWEITKGDVESMIMRSLEPPIKISKPESSND